MGTKRKRQLRNTTEYKTENIELEDIPNYKDTTENIITETNKTAMAVQSYGVVSVNISNVQELDEQVKSMIRKSENMVIGGSQKADMCTVCGKEGQRGSIKDHIEANHLEGVSLPCNS